MTSHSSIADTLASRTEHLTDEQIDAFFVSEKKPYVEKLLSNKPYLIVSGRGVGKSMLLRYAEIRADKDFQMNKVLTVYMTFENSLVLERLKVSEDGQTSPFRHWTFAKILLEVINKVEKLSPATQFGNLLDELFAEMPIASIRIALDSYISLLENPTFDKFVGLQIALEAQLASKVDKAVVEHLFEILNNTGAIKKFLNKIIEENGLERIVLLFDEAAHSLVVQQQNDFFTIFKYLLDKKISCKAAVYPAVTSYGDFFDPLHDAESISLDRYENEPDYLPFFLELLRRRLESNPEFWKMIRSVADAVETLCYACFGNPRALFNLVDRIDIQVQKRPLQLPIVTDVCKKFVQEELWKFHDNMASRSRAFIGPSSVGHRFIENEVIPRLVKQNNSWRSKSKPELSIYFAIEPEVYSKLKTTFDLLSYSGIIGQRGELNIGQNTNGKLYSVNTCIAISQSVLKRDRNTGGSYVKEIKLLRNQRLIQYSRGSNAVTDMIGAIKQSNKVCAKCGKSLDYDWKICPYCTTPVSEGQSIYFELISHPIDRLALSDAMKERIRNHRPKEYKTVKDILEATALEIDDIDYVGPVRVQKIKMAAEEYVAP